MRNDGFSLIEILVAGALATIVFGGIYLSYSAILDSVVNAELRTEALSVLNRQIEIFRNLPYDNVGTVGGIPAGVIPQVQTVTSGGVDFLVNIHVRNIDDPFDGTLGGNPNDTAPADYKLVEIEASCNLCAHFIPIAITTTVAPKNLESSSNTGSLFVNVFDSNGIPVSDATVHVINTQTSPTIDLTDTTNASGMLQLVGVPTSTQSYSISVSKNGYSSEKTYRIGDPQNPNPSKPQATVAANTVTQLSFAIDKVSSLAVKSSNALCANSSFASFTMNGAKIIGTNGGNDVLKFTTSTITDINGDKSFNSLEWDNYSLLYTATSADLMGTIPFSPITINPNTSEVFLFVTGPKDPNSLLVSVKDANSGDPIPGVSILLSKSGFSETQITGQFYTSETNWSSNSYTSQDGGIESELFPGSLKLKASASSTYSTTTVSWLISNTIDFGDASTTFHQLEWLPVSQPGSTGPDSVRIQLASNNDNTTWNFIGPDGTVNSYFNVSTSALPTNHNGNRYMRYKVYLQTASENNTPEVQSVKILFSGLCTPLGNTYFGGLGTGTYDLTATASGYVTANSTFNVSAGAQATTITLTPQ